MLAPTPLYHMQSTMNIIKFIIIKCENFLEQQCALYFLNSVEYEEKLMNFTCFCKNAGSSGHLRGIT